MKIRGIFTFFFIIEEYLRKLTYKTEGREEEKKKRFIIAVLLIFGGA